MSDVLEWVLQEVKCPVRGVIIDTYDFPATVQGQQGKGFRIYQENLDEFSDPQQQLIVEWLKGRCDRHTELTGIETGLDKDDVVPRI